MQLKRLIRMSWVYAVAEASISYDQVISLWLSGVELREGQRPIGPTEGFSPNLRVLEAIRARRVGLWVSPVFLGGATVVLAPFACLKTLPQEGLDRLWQKYGPWYDEVVLAAVRNTMAPALWNVAEPFGGMAESSDLEAERLKELAELSVYSQEGWLSFDVEPQSLSDAVIDEQREVWRSLDSEAPCAGSLLLRGLWLGVDIFDGQACIVSAGPIGDLAIVKFAKIETRRTGLRIRDGELDSEGQPLNRKMVAIARRAEGRSPIMFEFAPDGGLDPCGLHTPLSGEAVEYSIGHLFRAALGPHGLGWLTEV